MNVRTVGVDSLKVYQLLPEPLSDPSSEPPIVHFHHGWRVLLTSEDLYSVGACHTLQVLRHWHRSVLKELKSPVYEQRFGADFSDRTDESDVHREGGRTVFDRLAHSETEQKPSGDCGCAPRAGFPLIKDEHECKTTIIQRTDAPSELRVQCLP